MAADFQRHFAPLVSAAEAQAPVFSDWDRIVRRLPHARAMGGEPPLPGDMPPMMAPPEAAETSHYTTQIWQAHHMPHRRQAAVDR